MKYWLLTYQTSRDDRMSWQTWNAVTPWTPGDWLITFYDSAKKLRTGFTNVVLLNAIEITEDEYKRLDKVMEQ
jgi:hypothetical protein